MLWRSCILLFWLLTFSRAWAFFEEVPEFQPEQLELDKLQQLYQELGDTRLAFSSRSHIDQQGHDELMMLRVHSRGMQLLSGLDLPDHEQVKGNFQLAWHYPDTNKAALVLGSYRCAWGMGNVLSRQSDTNPSSQINSPPHPDKYALNGLSGSLGYGSMNLLALASRQKRSARLSEACISSLPSTRQPDLPDVEERVYGLGLQHFHKSYALGFLAYRQEYDKPFLDAAFRKKLNALSFYGDYHGSVINMQAEVSMLGSHPQARMELGYKLAKFSQQLGFNYTKGGQLAAYSARPGLLSAKGERQEYAYQIDAGLAKGFNLGFSSALSRANDALKTQNWNSRSIISAQYQASATRLEVQLTLLSRELLAETDSSYISTLPVHYRLGITLNRDLSSNLEYRLSLRYHYQEKTDRHENGVWTQNLLGWKHQGVRVCGGVKIWHSQRSMMVPETEGSGPEGFSLALGEDNRVFLQLNATYHWLRLGANVEQSWLDGERSLLLSLGTNLN